MYDLISHVVGESIMSVRLLHGADVPETVYGLDRDILGATLWLPSPRRRRPSTRPSTSPAPWSARPPSIHGHARGPATRVQDRRPHAACMGPGARLWRRRGPRPGVGRGSLGATFPDDAVYPQTGVFGAGPSGKVGDDAPLQVRLLDLTGRRPG